MTRHSPDGPATVPFVLPADASRGAARHRTPARSALRHGALAAGLTGGALALVAPAALQGVSTDGAQGALALSADDSSLDDSSGSTSSGGAVASTSESAASADLIKAVDRDRRTEAARVGTERAEAEEQRAGAARDQAARAEEQKKTSVTGCGASGSYGGVADSVQEVGNAMECVFPGHDVLGVGGRGGQSDHPDGYALDFMTTSGDAIAECVVDNADALGVSYVIWDQRINTGSGWEGMEDRGDATANHQDHVHISFSHGGSPDVSALGRCG